ncbi:hypothetical protein MAPG_10848 [Magnaporthiopsis poae ATCC 64411]|uniref:Uncharacterized protein n=1 Tax=Magnaporthiopsis poae (strain ATCC 64411 / 73-15) TaxID=644358 RepID=A0A0C4EDP2_MAGP6|nr:hypothetical protein MAPG_10848 [Magnaporthiopsis poae ATCC 64411]
MQMLINIVPDKGEKHKRGRRRHRPRNHGEVARVAGGPHHTHQRFVKPKPARAAGNSNNATRPRPPLRRWSGSSITGRSKHGAVKPASGRGEWRSGRGGRGRRMAALGAEEYVDDGETARWLRRVCDGGTFVTAKVPVKGFSLHK